MFEIGFVVPVAWGEQEVSKTRNARVHLGRSAVRCECVPHTCVACAFILCTLSPPTRCNGSVYVKPFHLHSKLAVLVTPIPHTHTRGLRLARPQTCATIVGPEGRLCQSFIGNRHQDLFRILLSALKLSLYHFLVVCFCALASAHQQASVQFWSSAGIRAPAAH